MNKEQIETIIQKPSPLKAWLYKIFNRCTHDVLEVEATFFDEMRGLNDEYLGNVTYKYCKCSRCGKKIRKVIR